MPRSCVNAYLESLIRDHAGNPRAPPYLDAELGARDRLEELEVAVRGELPGLAISPGHRDLILDRLQDYGRTFLADHQAFAAAQPADSRTDASVILRRCSCAEPPRSSPAPAEASGAPSLAVSLRPASA